jgi:hypothetical protein
LIERNKRWAAAEEFADRVRSRLRDEYSEQVVSSLMRRHSADIDNAFEDSDLPEDAAAEIIDYEGSEPTAGRPSWESRPSGGERRPQRPGTFEGRRIYKGPLPKCREDPPEHSDKCEGWYETPNCAAYFVAGRTSDWIPTPQYRGRLVPVERYSVCLSATQLARLMRVKKITGKEFGCGAFACVWPKGNRAIKFTHDPEDVAAALNAQDIRHVKKFYKVYKLVNSGTRLTTGEDTPVWAMVGEDTPQIPHSDPRRNWIEWLPTQRLFDDFEDWTLGRGYFPEDYQPGAWVDETTDRSCEYAPGGEKKQCLKFMRGYTDTWVKLARRGIVFRDAHEGNFGIDKKGNWKIIDLGLSKSDIPEEKVEALRGLRAGVQRRKRDKSARCWWLFGGTMLGLVLFAPMIRR